MGGYVGETPDGATGFETMLGLDPLGDNLAARVERAEELIGLMARTILDTTASRERIWVGSVAPSEVELPVPTAQAVEAALDSYRSPDELAARAAAEAYMAQYEEDRA